MAESPSKVRRLAESATDALPSSPGVQVTPFSRKPGLPTNSLPLRREEKDVEMRDVTTQGVPRPESFDDVNMGDASASQREGDRTGTGRRKHKPKTEAAGTSGSGMANHTPSNEFHMDDEVIAECDVYVNHMEDPEVFLGEIYMLQYPHRPVYRPYNDLGRLKHVDIDKNLKYLRMKYKLDTHSIHYNKQSPWQKKEHTLRGVPSVNPNVTYCVASMHQGRLTMTPLTSFLQCRAELDSDEETDEEDNLLLGGAAGSGGAEDSLFCQREVKVNMRKVNTVKENLLRVEKPEWEELAPFEQNTRETRDAYRQFIHIKSEVPVEFRKENLGESFVRHLCGAESHQGGLMGDHIDPSAGAGMSAGSTHLWLTTYVLSRMSLEQQVEAILWEAESHQGGLSTNEIRARLAPQVKKTMGPHDLIDVLQNACILVRDVWFLKHDAAGFDDWSARVREAVMLVLHKTEAMKMSKIVTLFGKVVPREVLTDIARSLGPLEKDTSDMDDKISLHKPEDRIGDAFPAVKERFNEYWDRRQKESVTKAMEEVKSAEPLNAQKVRSLQETRLKSRLLHEVRVLLTTSARTVADLQKRTQQRHPNNNIIESLLVSVLQKASLRAATIRSVWYLRNVGGWLDPYRQCVIAIFKDDAFATMDQVCAELAKKGLEPLTDLRLRQCISEFATLDGERWIFRE